MADQKDGQTVDEAVGQLRVEDVELEVVLKVEVDNVVLEDTTPDEGDDEADVVEDEIVVLVTVVSVVAGGKVGTLEVDDDGDAVVVSDEVEVVVTAFEDVVDATAEVGVVTLVVVVGLFVQEATGASDPAK